MSPEMESLRLEIIKIAQEAARTAMVWGLCWGFALGSMLAVFVQQIRLWRRDDHIRLLGSWLQNYGD